MQDFSYGNLRRPYRHAWMQLDGGETKDPGPFETEGPRYGMSDTFSKEGQ